MKGIYYRLLILSLLVVTSVGAAGTDVWQEGPRVDSELQERSAAAVRAWVIEPSPRSLAADRSHLTLSIPGQDELTVQRKRVFRQSGDTLTWVGSTAGDDTEVVLTHHQGWLTGIIQMPEAVYEIRPDAEFGTLLIELDPAAFPECDGGIDPQLDEHIESITSQPPSGPARGMENPAAAKGDTQEPVEMDLLVLYTPAARQALGGTVQIEAHAIAAIGNANNSFANSLVDAYYNIAAIVEIDYSESNNCTLDLNWVRSSPVAQQLRNDHHADMVGMLTNVTYCGCGYVMRNPGPAFASSAFQVTATHCAVGNLTYAHEHGHNMGMEHDPANGTSPGNASYPWSFGHFVSGQFRTVMSYSNQCSGSCARRMHLSNPHVRFNGYPTGIANERDNARTAELTAPIVRDFRTPPPALPIATISPDSLSFSVEQGEFDAAHLDIENSGNAGLDWSVNQSPPGCELPEWMIADPLFGSLDDDESGAINVTVDATDLASGQYQAMLCVATNDPDNSLIETPVALTVLEPTSVVQGIVESQGYCQINPAPAAKADILIEGQDDTYAGMTDDEGYYQIEVPIFEQPITVHASLDNHLTVTVDGVKLSGEEQSVTLDLELVVDAPCATLEPGNVAFSLVTGEASEMVTISNVAGGATLHWWLAASEFCPDYKAGSWLSMATASGAVHAGDSQDIPVMATVGSLEPGTYQTNLCVTTNDDEQDTLIIPALLQVQPQDILQDRFQLYQDR